MSEFFEYTVQTILFQRGVYPAEDFTPVKKYGLNMLVSSDDQVKAYLKKIMSQLHRWMGGGKISKLVVVITDKDTGENLERWQFDVCILLPLGQIEPHRRYIDLTRCASQVQIFSQSSSKTKSEKQKGSEDKENTSPPCPPSAAATPQLEKTEAQIQAEIQSIFRQITASVTFLPQLDGNCTFNVLVYADADSEVPMEWGDSDAKEIKNGEKVQLRSFSTSSHRVDTMVSYRLAD